MEHYRVAVKSGASMWPEMATRPSQTERMVSHVGEGTKQKRTKLTKRVGLKEIPSLPVTWGASQFLAAWNKNPRVPQGQPENSPQFQLRVRTNKPVKSRRDDRVFSRPSGTHPTPLPIPALKRRAIIKCPSRDSSWPMLTCLKTEMLSVT
jgi:hypothetical protein